LLLGCTHFPVFRSRLQQLLGAQVQVIDSAQTTASAVSKALQADGLLFDGGGATQFLATDGVDRFCRVGATFLGESISSVELIDL
jgi:glutamate racemase